MRGQHHSQPLGPGLLVAVIVDRDADGDAGVVDDDVEPAEMFGDIVDDRGDVVAISVTATLAPSAANTCAVARPMPLAAPVTRTVRPLTERLSCLNSDMERSLAMALGYGS
jgi:hypothetical protein